MNSFDVIVIGGGAGGLTAAAGAASFGKKTALIHKGPLGGDCLWTGCVPSKSLLHVSQIVHTANQATKYGFSQITSLPFQQVVHQVVSSIETIQKHDSPERFHEMGIKLYEGTASFIDSHTVAINDRERIRGKKIIVATGSRHIIPEVQGLKETGFITNETFFKQPDLPARWLVIGGGPVGLEFSQALGRFGCKATLVEQMPQLLSYGDPEIVEVLEDRLQQGGISILTETRVREVSKVNASIQVVIEKNGEHTLLEVDQILVAAGRKPNIEELSLESAGIRVESGCIQVNDRMETSRPHIYAVGDVNGRAPYTHVAGWEAKVAITNALFGTRRKVDYSSIPTVIFTDPEIFHLGLTEWEARKRYSKIRTYKTKWSEVDRFIVEDLNYGLIKIVTDHKGNILGAQAAGKGISDSMQEVVFAKQHGHKIGSLSQVIHPYLTYAEAVQKSSDLYWREKLFSGNLGKWLRSYLRWFTRR